MVLRCTGKVLKLLGVNARSLSDFAATPDDWYLNLLWIGGRKCLLLTHSGTLFSIFIPDVRKKQMQSIGPFVAEHARQALERERLPANALGELDPGPIIAKTSSRSVLGFMVDMAFVCEDVVAQEGGLANCDIEALNRFLQRQLHNTEGFYSRPIDLVRDWVALE